MIRNIFMGLLTLAGLAACSSSDGDPGASGRKGGSGREFVGGNSGSEGSRLPCDPTATALPLEAVSDLVGASGADLIALANQQAEIALRWPARDSGPMFDTSARVLGLKVEPGSGPVLQLVCEDSSYRGTDRPKPRLELPVFITLRTADGALDARIEAVLSAESRERAQIASVQLNPEAVGGTVGSAVAEFYAGGSPTLLFEASFTANGAYGWVAGPFSPHVARPCAYTAYAYWPADSKCWPELEGAPSDDDALMQPHLARVNTSFDLEWQDGRSTKARLEVELSEGTTCAGPDQASHPVKVRIVTSDGRVELTLPAILSGGESRIDPWPAALSAVDPFGLDLAGSIALDAEALKDQLGYEQPNVSAAIVSVYLSSPSSNDSPLLMGGLRVAPIDRTGFDSSLPTVQLPGGDSEGCFSSARGRGAVLRGELTLD
jgi:hypothetical protein